MEHPTNALIISQPSNYKIKSMTNTSPSAKRFRLASVLFTLMAPWAYGQVNFDGTAYTENFDGLVPTTGIFGPTAGVQTAIPGASGWSGAKLSGSSGSATGLVAGNGGGNSGGLYSLGTTDSTERALGAVASGSNTMGFGVALTNTSGHTITSVTIRYTAEVWRSSTAQQNTLTFSYGLGSSGISATDYLTNSGMSTYPSLDLVGPAPVGTNGALDGNVVPNAQLVTALIDGLNWENGSTLFIRWTDFDNGGSDAALAVDDFLIVEGVYVDENDVSRGTANNLFTPTSFAGNAFSADKNAVFDGAAATTTLSGAVLANALKFTSDDHSLVGGPTDSISLASGEIVVNPDVTATISGVIAGTQGLNKTGTGTLVLSGANTFVGDVLVSAGRIELDADAALGAADNDLVVGGTLALTSAFELGSARTISGSGVIETPADATLVFGGPLQGAALALEGPASVSLDAADNSVSSLVFDRPVALSVATGDLTVSSRLEFAQTSGASTLDGGLAFGNVTASIVVNGGSFSPLGAFTSAQTGGARIIKTGAGTLDLTSTTRSGTGAFRIGVQGGFPSEGGRLVVDEATDLGTLQTQFNSGTLELRSPMTITGGLSLGGRANSSVSRPTFEGSDLVVEGDSGFFAAGGASGDLGLTVNNTTTLAGTLARTVNPSVTTPVPTSYFVDLTGSGALVFSGDAGAFLDSFYVHGGAELVIAGTLGGNGILVDSGSTLSGGGTYSGYYIPELSSETTTVPENHQPTTITIYGGGTLAPSGVLTLESNLTFESGADLVLTIDGPTQGSGYDSLALRSRAGSGLTNTLSLGGHTDLSLVFGSPAKNGAYQLLSLGAGGVLSGGFGSVTLAGSHTGPLGRSGTVWSGSSGGATFSFDESTGVLTVTGGVSPTSPLEDWRQTYFGTTANLDDAADTADPDGDGLANLLEYATGTAPDVANASPVVIGKSGDGQFLTLSFDRINDPSITYTIEAGNDLAAGFTATGTTYTGTADDTVTYTDTVALSTPGLRRFLRLVVSY